MTKILVLSEVSEYIPVLRKVLRKEGWEVTWEHEALAAERSVLTNIPDIIITTPSIKTARGTSLLRIAAANRKPNTYALFLLVPQGFSDHHYYPEPDDFLEENGAEGLLVQTISNYIGSSEMLPKGMHTAGRDAIGEKVIYFEQELLNKDKELSYYLMLIAKKNDQLKDILTDLMQLNDSGFESRITRIRNKIANYLKGDQTMESFFQFFMKINPEFYHRLEEKQALTIKEKKHCAYIKMGLDNKEISFLLSINPNSIKRAHTRLKVKIGLPENVSLRKFIGEL